MTSDLSPPKSSNFGKRERPQPAVTASPKDTLGKRLGRFMRSLTRSTKVSPKTGAVRSKIRRA